MIRLHRRKRKSDQRGQLLLELMLSVSIAAIILAVTGSLVYVSARASQSSAQQNIALGLLQETLEAANASARESWQNVAGLTKNSVNYSPAISSGKWIINSGADTVTLNTVTFNRSFIVQNVCRDSTTRNITGLTDSSGSSTTCTGSGGAYDSSTQQITASVSWSSFGNLVQQSEYITRWGNKICTQNSWSLVAAGPETCPPTDYSAETNVTTGASLQLCPGGC